MRTGTSKFRARSWLRLGIIAVCCAAVHPHDVNAEEPEFTSEFMLKKCRFTAYGANPFFSLEIGRLLVFEGEEDGETIYLEIEVLREKECIRLHGVGWINTRVIEEREYIDGELAEVSRNFYAICKRTNDVFYFGEEVDFYEDGEIVGHEGAWRAGVDGAMPGIIMPGTFLLGSRYFQEIAPGVALDRAEHVEMGLTVETPAGVFKNCVRIIETSPLEPGAESEKIYCPGVGLIKDGILELIDAGFVGDDDDDDD